MKTTAEKILQRIRKRGRGSVYVTQDFLDLGARAAVDQALSRLTRRGELRRLSQGLYDFPKLHPRFGTLSPDPSAIAQAAARKTGSRIQVSGAQAANSLGMTTQVPARLVFLTDGPSKQIRIGAQVIALRHVSPRNMAGAGKTSGAVIQALRHLGRDAIDDGVVARLKKTLSDDDKAALRVDAAAPDWVRSVVANVVA
jgi:predicted transcriptional regulator of viral defense system